MEAEADPETKAAVTHWATVATYVVTYPDDDGETGAANVDVQIGALTSAGPWFIRTRDDAGGSDDAGDGAFPTQAAAVAAAVALARALDEATEAEDAEAYLARALDAKLVAAEAVDGRYRLVSSRDGRAWDAPRFRDRGAAQKWAARWRREVSEAHPGTQILFSAMDHPVVEEVTEDA